MRVLLDTHVWVWTQEQPDRIGPRTKRLLIGTAHDTVVCPVSTLEISRLVAAGYIELSMPLVEWVVRSMTELGAETVSMTHEIAVEAYGLPGTFHQDPADRILVATARQNGLTLVTADDRILSYPHVQTEDARR